MLTLWLELEEWVLEGEAIEGLGLGNGVAAVDVDEVVDAVEGSGGLLVDVATELCVDGVIQNRFDRGPLLSSFRLPLVSTILNWNGYLQLP